MDTDALNRCEERLRELEDECTRLLAVLQQLPTGVILAEAGTGRVVATNTLADDLLARSREARKVFGAVPPHRRGNEAGEVARNGALGRALGGERTSGEDFELELDDGSRVPIDLSAAPVHGADGEVIGAVLTFQSQSERTRREHAAREFVSNAAHELRTPLAAITSAVDVLQAGAKEIPGERDLFLAHIERESRRLGHLTRALLILARAEIQEELPAPELVELRPLLNGVAAGLRPAGGVEVIVECDPGLAVLAHRDLIEQALLGIAANAARYTSEGSIRMSAHGGDAGAVAINVVDTGRGMSAVECDRAFERFYRGVRIGDGFGLGLAIAGKAVEVLGGRIELTSQPGAGTAVRIVLDPPSPVGE